MAHTAYDRSPRRKYAIDPKNPALSGNAVQKAKKTAAKPKRYGKRLKSMEFSSMGFFSRAVSLPERLFPDD